MTIQQQFQQVVEENDHNPILKKAVLKALLVALDLPHHKVKVGECITARRWLESELKKENA